MFERKLVLITILQILSSIQVSGSTTEAKKVVCYYGGMEAKDIANLYPEDIDPFVCTHIVYMLGDVDTDLGEIVIRPLGGEDGKEAYHERLIKLKEANPDLKLMLLVAPRAIPWVLESEDRRPKIIKSAVRLLNATSFDGMEFRTSAIDDHMDALSTLMCELHAEFEKHGYIISSLASDTLEGDSPEPLVERLSRCCSYISLPTFRDYRTDWNTTRLIAPISLTRTMVNRYVEKGYPVNKLLVSLPTFALIYTLEYPKETGLGASIDGPGANETALTDGIDVFYNWLLNDLNDTSEGWTVVRNEEADSPYAYSKTGRWATYEDPISAAAKARFILEKNLGGVLFFPLDMADFEGPPGKTFSVVRAVSDTFKQAASATDTIL